jgi:hypothetical protein
MPIQGPLRELGIHDVFQLLDLSRKTGVLHVSSELREDEGFVFFDGGRVIHASIRSRPGPAAAPREVSQREIDRQLRLRIQTAVFDLMSWSEGFFSFEERPRHEMDVESRVSVSTESLLMEGARRIDEWTRIADVIPNVEVIPELAPADPNVNGATLDLLPHEWQVLTMIDGARDLRDIAGALPREEFEVAKIAYGLATTGIITLRRPVPVFIDAESSDAASHVAAARALTLVGRHADALDELRRAVQEDPLTPGVHLDFGFAAARTGDLESARASWEHVLRLTQDVAVGTRARDALDALDQLTRVLEAHADDCRLPATDGVGR